jgi:hypothetical protein
MPIAIADDLSVDKAVPENTLFGLTKEERQPWWLAASKVAGEEVKEF